jgi:peptidoglycan/xylan/chitin deacetylase (PgdA/CDA1 family)
VPVVRRRRSRGAQILLFHRVRPEPDPYLPSMPVTDFARQMECLRRWFRVCELEEILEGVERGDVPENAVAITFDDGYRDNFDHALPVLRALGLPATFFLATGVISGASTLWHDRVFRAFALTAVPHLGAFGDEGAIRRLAGPAEREAARDAVLGYLKTLHPRRRDGEIDDLVRRLGVPDEAPAQRIMLTWDEVARMRREGCAFGAHTVTHPVLSRLSLDEARHELLASRRTIEERLGEPCRVLAYPNGRPADYSPAIKELVRETGFRWALSTVFGVHPPRGAGDADQLEIRRMAIA